MYMWQISESISSQDTQIQHFVFCSHAKAQQERKVMKDTEQQARKNPVDKHHKEPNTQASLNQDFVTCLLDPSM